MDYRATLGYQLKEYNKSDLKATIAMFADEQKNVTNFLYTVFYALIENQNKNIDSQNRNFFEKLFKDLDPKAKSQIRQYFSTKTVDEIVDKIAENLEEEDIPESVYSGLEKIKELIDSSDTENIKAVSKNINQLIFMIQKLNELEKENLDDLGDKKTKDLDDGSKIVEREFDISTLGKFKKDFSRTITKSNQLFEKYIKLNTFIIKKIRNPDLFNISRFSPNAYIDTLHEESKIKEYYVKQTKDYASVDIIKNSKILRPLYITKNIVRKVLHVATKTFFSDICGGALRAIDGLGSFMMTWAAKQINQSNNAIVKHMRNISAELEWEVKIIISVIKGAIFTLKLAKNIALGVLKMLYGFSKTFLNLSISIFKGTIHLIHFIGKNILSVFSYLKRTSLVRFTAKSVIAFFATRPGAYILGYIIGFFYNKILALKDFLYERIIDFKVKYVDPIFNLVEDILNGDIFEALDSTFDQFNDTYLEPIMELVSFVSMLPEIFKSETFYNLKHTVGSGVAKLAGATVGGYLGALAGTLIPIPGASIVTGMIGAYVGEKLAEPIYSWMTGYYKPIPRTQEKYRDLNALQEQLGVEQTNTKFSIKKNPLSFPIVNMKDSDMVTRGADETKKYALLTGKIDEKTFAKNWGFSEKDVEMYNFVFSLIEGADAEYQNCIQKTIQEPSGNLGLKEKDYEPTIKPLSFSHSELSHFDYKDKEGKWISPHRFRAARAYLIRELAKGYINGSIDLDEFKKQYDLLADVNSPIYSKFGLYASGNFGKKTLWSEFFVSDLSLKENQKYKKISELEKRVFDRGHIAGDTLKDLKADIILPDTYDFGNKHKENQFGSYADIFEKKLFMINGNAKNFNELVSELSFNVLSSILKSGVKVDDRRDFARKIINDRLKALLTYYIRKNGPENVESTVSQFIALLNDPKASQFLLNEISKELVDRNILSDEVVKDFGNIDLTKKESFDLGEIKFSDGFFNEQMLDDLILKNDTEDKAMLQEALDMSIDTGMDLSKLSLQVLQKLKALHLTQDQTIAALIDQKQKEKTPTEEENE